MINVQSQKEKNGLVTKCAEAYSKTLGTNSLFRLSKKYPTKPQKLISHFLDPRYEGSYEITTVNNS